MMQKEERTVAIIKPDAFERGLVETVLDRLRQTGLGVVKTYVLRPTEAHLDKHFPQSHEWVKSMGSRACERIGERAVECFGTTDPYHVGRTIVEGCREYYLSGSVMAVLLEGPDAISRVRAILGSALPDRAEPGTIRSDLGEKGQSGSLVYRGAARNLIHASDTTEDAMREIECWFPEYTLLFDRYIVSVTCVVLSKDARGELKALIVKRSDEAKDGPGLWAIPGGKVDRSDWGVPNFTTKEKTWDNVPNQAILRELTEETGISIDACALHLFPVGRESTIWIRSDGTPGFILRYWTYLQLRPDVILCEELSEYRWISRAELADYAFLGNIAEDVRIAMKEQENSMWS